MGKETTFAADDAENLHFIRLRKNVLLADTDRPQLYEDMLGIRSLLEIRFFKILFFNKKNLF